MTVNQRRRVLAFGILIVWAAVVAVHVRREYFKPDVELLAARARALGPGTYFYEVRMEAQAIGIATSRVDTLANGFRVTDQITLDVPALDRVHRATAETRIELDRSLRLVSFDFDLGSRIGRFKVRGRADGDSALALEVGAGGDVERSTMPLDGSTVLAAVAPMRLAAAGALAEGRETRLRILDPSIMAARDVTIRVGGRERMVVPDSAAYDPEAGAFVAARHDTVPVWRLEERYGGIRVASWVDDDGRLVRAESPLGFTIERTEYELARQGWARTRDDPRSASGYGAIIEGTAVSSNVRLSDVQEVDRLAVRLLDVGLDGFDLSGGRQALAGDTLVIEREDPAAIAAGYELPYRGGGGAAGELGATPLIQASDPRIVRAAREIGGGETDPIAVARKLNEWVHSALEKDLTLSVPSAVQVLESRQGDCNEHTVLYVALARALGLPARTAVGLVHLRGRFYYHAWPEVWLGEWVAVDPTLGQFPADAAHLRFIVGGLARQVELVRLVGRLRLEVL